MAASDSFMFLWKELCSTFGKYRDGLAVVGGLYITCKTLKTLLYTLRALHRHGIIVNAKPTLTSYGKWAVVTGCTGGIGLAFAHELARGGMNIILVGRNKSKVCQVSDELKDLYRVETCEVVVDFTDGQSVYTDIAEEVKQRNVGILVNNVGVNYTFPHFYTKIPEKKLWQLVNVNIAAATLMTHMVLPQMTERGRGAVIFLSSGASEGPTPQLAAYSATKAYLAHLSRSLHYEYSPKGVDVLCLRPFNVATRMTSFSDRLSRPGFLVPTANQYVTSALKYLGRSREAEGYWPHTVMSWILRSLSRDLYATGCSALMTALRREARNKLQRQGHLGSMTPSESQLVDFDLPEASQQPTFY